MGLCLQGFELWRYDSAVGEGGGGGRGLDLNTWRTSRLGGGGGKAVCFIRWEEAGPLHAVRQVGLTGGIQQRRSCLSADGCPQGSVEGWRLGGSSGLFT